MSYIRAPRLHQSTARLCPLLIKISGALQQCERTNVSESTVSMRGEGEQVYERVREGDLHVFDGTTEGVGDCAIVNRLFTQPKVCQLHMAWKENMFTYNYLKFSHLFVVDLQENLHQITIRSFMGCG